MIQLTVRYLTHGEKYTAQYTSANQSKDAMVAQMLRALYDQCNGAYQVQFIEFKDTDHPERYECIRYDRDETADHPRTHQQFRILESRTIGHAEFVLGYHPNASKPYVCWNCTNGIDYDSGAYYDTKEEAVHEMNLRCETEWQK